MKKIIEPPFPPRDIEELTYWLNRLGGPFTFTEIMVTALVVVLAIAAPRLGSRLYGRIEHALGPLAHHAGWQIAFVGVLAIVARAVVLPWLGTPVPGIHDEMSIVLQAQTFLQGRLANPAHPLWEHFETIYVNQIPAYASMYFPGRGAPLAIGLLIANHVWAGVWLSCVLMAMAAVWMLQGWVSKPMALLGGVMVVVRFGIFSSFINSYLGGAFSALGAMLVVGALPRVIAQPGWGNGVMMALGAGILMVARPFEGALLCIPIALLLMVKLARPAWQGGRLAFARVALPSAAVIGACGALMLAHNHATTGNYLKTPYDLHRVTYANVPAFLSARPIESERRGLPHMREFYAVEAEKYERRHDTRNLIFGMGAKLFYSWNYYVGVTLAIPFFAGLWVFRRNYFLWGALAFFYAGYFLETWNFPQYSAPIYPLLLIITMRGFEKLRTFEWRSRPIGLFLTRAIPTAAIVTLALPAGSVIVGKPHFPNTTTQSCCNIEFDKLRPLLVEKFRASPGRDLVIVKDGPYSPMHYELVNNEPDIDKSDIVWAHSLGEEKDRALRRYFADRRVWQFDWLPGAEEDPGAGRARNSKDGQPGFYRLTEIGGAEAQVGQPTR
jgi:hypothetical protein